MENNKKKRFHWRGMTTFLLVLGLLVETVSGIIIFITPLGRFARWNNWTLLGLDKWEWAAIHSIFAILLLTIIYAHLYFNWRVIVHFVWSRLRNAVNLKWELAVSLAITILLFTGTILNIPPFSSVMDWGRDAKLSWEKNGDVASIRGGRWSQAAHVEEDRKAYQGGGGRWANAQTFLATDKTNRSETGMGRGRSNRQFNDQSSRRGQGRGQRLNQYNINRAEPREDIGTKTSENLKGRDFVRLGKIGTLTGTLVQKGDEWELKVGDTLYEIHMGPSDYRNTQGLVLKDGTKAVVTGFIYGTDLSVTTIETGGKSVTLRDETGRPAWAGTSFGRGAGAERR